MRKSEQKKIYKKFCFVFFSDNLHINKNPLLFSIDWYVAGEKRLKLRILSNFIEIDFSR